MPSLKAIRTRIGSVKNTQKITRAMKLVAAARLRRAQDSIVAARPYARGLEEVIAELAQRAGNAEHPLLAVRPMKRIELLVMTSDRGLAGAFNSQVNRATERYVYEHPEQDVQIVVIGRRGRDYLRRRKVNLVSELAGVTAVNVLERSQDAAVQVIQDYSDGKLDGVFMVYNEFKSAISQQVRVEQILPVPPKPLDAGANAGDFVYEPSQRAVLDHILPLYVRIEIYRALLESIASEFGARMSAMDNATNNAREMIANLTLDYNRARQASITKELLEIIGGAEALKG